MSHRACVINVSKNLGFPDGLPQVIADYAALTGYCRFDILLQKFPIGLIFHTGRYTYHSLYMNRFWGVWITSFQAPEFQYTIPLDDFIEYMENRHINFNIKRISQYSEELSQLDNLSKELTDLWWSI